MKERNSKFHQQIKKFWDSIIAYTVTVIVANCYIYNLYLSYRTSEKLLLSFFVSSPYLSLIVFLTNILLCFALYFKYFKKTIKPDLLSIKNTIEQSPHDRLSEYINLNNGNFAEQSVINYKLITDIEQNVNKGNEIWIISSDIVKDSKDEGLLAIIERNLEKGIKYRFFIAKLNGAYTSKALEGEKSLKKNSHIS